MSVIRLCGLDLCVYVACVCVRSIVWLRFMCVYVACVCVRTIVWLRFMYVYVFVCAD